MIKLFKILFLVHSLISILPVIAMMKQVESLQKKTANIIAQELVKGNQSCIEEIERQIENATYSDTTKPTDIEFHSNEILENIRQALVRQNLITIIRKMPEEAYNSIRRPFGGQVSHQSSVIFSPDSKYVVAFYLGGTICNLENFACTMIVRHEKKIHSALFSSDSKFLLTSSKDKTIFWYMNEDKIYTTEVTDHTDKVNFMLFSPNNKWAITSSDDRALLWDLTDPLHIKTTLVREWFAFTTELFSSNNRYLIATHSNQTFFYDLLLEDSVFGFPLTDTDIILGSSRDGRYMVTRSLGRQPKTILWDLTTLEPKVLSTGKISNYATFSNNNQYVIISSEIETSVWDIDNGIVLHSEYKNIKNVRFARFSKNNKYLVLRYDYNNPMINLIDLTNKDSVPLVLSSFKPGNLPDIQFAPDGMHFITNSKDNTYLWDLTQNPAAAILINAGEIKPSSVSYNANVFIAMTHEGLINVWDLLNPLEPYNLPEFFKNAVFSPDGNSMVTIDNDDRADVWDISFSSYSLPELLEILNIRSEKKTKSILKETVKNISIN